MTENREFPELTVNDMKLINNFLDQYEQYLSREKVGLSMIEELSQKKRELIFRAIETSIEQTGDYNLVRIIESHAFKRINMREEDEEILDMNYLSLFSLFKFPKLPDLKFSLSNKFSSINTSKTSDSKSMPLETTSDNSEPSEPLSDNSILEEPKIAEELILPEDSEENLLNRDVEVNIDHEMAKKFVNKKYKGYNKLFRNFFVTLFVILFLVVMVVITLILAYSYGYLGQIVSIPGSYVMIYGIYYHEILISLILSPLAFASIIMLHYIFKLFLKIPKKILENKIGQLMLLNDSVINRLELSELGGIISEMSYFGALTVKGVK